MYFRIAQSFYDTGIITKYILTIDSLFQTFTYQIFFETLWC